MKQQYLEAYRVTRQLALVYHTLAEELAFIDLFRWNFSRETYLLAYRSFHS